LPGHPFFIKGTTVHDDHRAGFTLIELLLVIIVLGILATIVIFASGHFASDSKTAACEANARILNTAEAAYSTLHPGDTAAGDLDKLKPFLTDVPTTGNGAVAYNADTSRWACA
jgi:prepilin-type N-terminal cleavage/methylation domain-containing protein